MSSSGALASRQCLFYCFQQGTCSPWQSKPNQAGVPHFHLVSETSYRSWTYKEAQLLLILHHCQTPIGIAPTPEGQDSSPGWPNSTWVGINWGIHYSNTVLGHTPKSELLQWGSKTWFVFSLYWGITDKSVRFWSIHDDDLIDIFTVKGRIQFFNEYPKHVSIHLCQQGRWPETVTCSLKQLLWFTLVCSANNTIF